MRMRFVFLMVLLMSMVAGTGIGIAAMYEDPQVEYSAEQWMTAEGKSIMSKVYHAHQKMRMEMSGMVTISRMDRKVTWMLMPENSSYQEFSMEEAGKHGGQTMDPTSQKIEMTQLGQETVNGISCTKNKVVVTAPDGHKSEGTMWLSREGIMVKMVSSDPAMGAGKQVTVELKNLKIGKQAPSLFEVPADYAKAPSFNMFGGPPPNMPPPAAKNKPAVKVDPGPGRAYTAATGRSYTAARQRTNQPASSATSNVDPGSGRAYTATTGRSYTAEQQPEEGGATGALKKGADVLRGVQGLRGLFGR